MKKLHLFLFSILISVLLAPSVYAYPYFWTVYAAEDGLPNSNVRTISIDPGGYIWIGTQGDYDEHQGAVSILDPMYELAAPYDTSDGLCSNIVKGIAFEPVREENYDDTEYGAVWFATQNGISILDIKGVFTTITSRNSPLTGNSIRTIVIDSENTKWISLWGNGVCCVDSDFNWGKYTRADGLCSNYIISIKEDVNGNIWFGSKDRGVSRLDRDGNWVHFSSANSGLIGNCILKIAEQPPNRLWFATPDGISVFDGQNWMSYTSRNSPVGNLIPTTMVIDRSGNKWIGTERGGILKMDNFGMWTHFHKDNTSLPDNMINSLVIDSMDALWIGTPSGLCRLGNFPQTQQHVLPEQQLQEPASSNFGQGTYYPFEHGLMWENIGEAEVKPELLFALPSFFHGGMSWFYASFWADQDFSFKDLSYSIEGDRRGNMRLRLSGNFSSADFLICGGSQSTQENVTIDKKNQYLFPVAYPDELEEFLMPGRKIPSNDTEIKTISQSLVRPDSQGDMYKTVRDIVYSKLLQHMGLESKDIGLLSDKEPGEEDARIDSPKDVGYLLKNMKGDSHSKARLICSLARAEGIPARIVMSLAGSIWSQVWISGIGWVPVEASYPVYDYVRPLRTYMPKIYSRAEHAIAAVSGRDDDVGRVLWDSRIKAYYVKNSPEELKDYRQMSMAKLLLIKIVSAGQVPDNAMIRMAEDLFVFARQTQDEVLLVFQDKAGRQVKTEPVSFEGLSNFVNIKNTFFWNFIPRRTGDILVIENLECRSVQETIQSVEPTEEGLPFGELNIQ